MKDFLEEVSKQTDEISEVWIQERRGTYGTKVVDDAVEVWRTLKALTEGEARKVVNSVRNENGYHVWQKLHLRFERGLAARQGMVLA